MLDAVSDSLEEFVRRLEKRGAVFSMEGERLRVRAPKGVVDAETSAAIKQRKAELIAYLENRAGGKSRWSPLGLIQERMWAHQVIEEDTAVYKLATAWRINGKLDLVRLSHAFAAVIANHEVLSIRIDVIDGAPRQFFDELENYNLPIEDVSPENLGSRINALREEPIDLGAAPLFHARLLKLADDELVLFFMPHHAIWDGLSFEVFLRDLCAAYENDSGHSIAHDAKQGFRTFVGKSTRSICQRAL